MNFLKNIKIGFPSVGQIIFWVITAALAIGGFVFVRNMVVCWTITYLPGTAPSTCGTVNSAQNGPIITTN